MASRKRERPEAYRTNMACPKKQSGLLCWINPWGLASASLAGLAVFLAVQAGIWELTLATSSLGLAIAVVGLWGIRDRLGDRTRASIVLGGLL